MTEETKKVLELLKDSKADLIIADKHKSYDLASTVKSKVSQHFDAKNIHNQNLDYVIKCLGIIRINDSNMYPFGNLDDIKNCFQGALDSLINEIDKVGLPGKKSSNKNNSNMVVNITQTQEQHQKQELSLFLECVKKELGGEELGDNRLKELKEIALQEPDDEGTKRNKIIEKLKSFGDNVCSNIVANILTNPTI